jgi:hypothetical protein
VSLAHAVTICGAPYAVDIPVPISRAFTPSSGVPVKTQRVSHNSEVLNNQSACGTQASLFMCAWSFVHLRSCPPQALETIHGQSIYWLSSPPSTTTSVRPRARARDRIFSVRGNNMSLSSAVAPALPWGRCSTRSYFSICNHLYLSLQTGEYKLILSPPRQETQLHRTAASFLQKELERV